MTRSKTARRAPRRAEVPPRPAPARAQATAPVQMLSLVGLVVIGALLRLQYVGQPMRYDESVTYLYFAAKSWTTVVSSYTYPNNHVFHTLLVKACASVFGSEPWALRLPALFAGLAMIPATFWVGRRLFGPAAAYVGAGLVAASGAVVLYSTNARGYSMVCLASLVLCGLLLRLRERPSASLWAASVGVMALGMWTVPVMLFPAGGLVLWFVLSALHGDTSARRADLVRATMAVISAAIVTVLLYAPIIRHGGWGALAGNRFVRPSPWGMFFTELSSSIDDVLAGWALGFPLPISLALGACAVVGLVNERRTSGMRVSMAGSMYLWCALVLLVTHRAPFPRVWLFLVAPVALLASHGMLWLLRDVPLVRERLVPRAGVVAIGWAMALALVVILSRDVVMSRDTGTLRDAEPIAQALSSRLRPGDRVIAPLPSNAPLAYYFVRAGLDTTYLSASPRDSAGVYIIVNTGEGFTANTPVNEPLLRRFRGGDLIVWYPSAEVYRLRWRDR